MSKYQQYINEGRGQGKRAGYVPWIKIQDFASCGMVSRVKGIKTGRVHHFLSNLELAFFYILDWSDDVLDIREQYPLSDINQAIAIADKADIKYPYDHESGFPYVMTSDFFVDTIRGPQAFAIKPAMDLEKPRVREKLEIERRYWKNLNVRWRLVTENEIDRTKAKNIEWLSQARDLGSFCIPKEEQRLFTDYFMARYPDYADSLGTLMGRVEQAFKLPAGMGLNIYKYLAYWKRLPYNAGIEVDFSRFMDSLREECVGGVL